MKNYMLKTKIGFVALAILATIFTQAPVASAESISTTCGSTTTTRISGFLNLNGNTSATVWFDWGSTTGLGHSTERETFTSNSNFSQPIYNLTPGNTYYYRAMGYNDNDPSKVKSGAIKTFKVTCENGGDDDGDRPTVEIRADDTSVDFDDRTIVRWTSEDADTCRSSGGTNGWPSTNRSKSGTFNTGDLTRDVTFTITCTNENGSATDSVTIRVDEEEEEENDRPTVDIWANPITVTSGNSSVVSWSSTDADTCRATGGTSNWAGNRSRSGSFNTGSLTRDVTFTIRCENEEGSATDSVTVSVIGQPVNNQPTVSVYADNTNLAYNGATTVRWTSTNATSCVGSGGSVGWPGSKSIGSGSFYTGNLTSTRTYTLTCNNSSGSASDFVTIAVRALPTPAPAPTPRPAGNSLIIVSSSVDRNQPIVPTLDNTNPCPGDEINYTVTYQNIGTAGVTSLVLRVDLPFEVDYLYSTPSSPTRAGQTLIFSLGTLRAGGQGTVSIRVRVRDGAKENTPLNFPAILTYVDNAGFPQSVAANVSANVCPLPTQSLVVLDTETNRVGLSANVFGAGFLPENLFGWLLLIILILVLILLLRHLFGPSPWKEKKVVTTTYGNPVYGNQSGVPPMYSNHGPVPPSNLPGATTTTTIHQ